ncbi:MAG: phosphate ABC transporter permease PstA [Candidatus Gallimonas sp.]
MDNTLHKTQNGKRRINVSKGKEKTVGALFFVCAGLSVVAVFGIIAYILYASVPAFRECGFFQMLFGAKWNTERGEYGLLTMLVNTLVVTFGALLIGGTIGVFTAIFLVFWCPDRFHLRYEGKNRALRRIVRAVNAINLRTVFDQVIKLLSGIPSVIFGYFGVSVICAMIKGMDVYGIGKGPLASALVLAIMIVPTIASLSKNALEAVPQSYFEGALALGNTKAQAVFRVVFPAARSGVVSALILGVGRAVGETMAVAMVSGGRVFFPEGLFTPVRTLTTNIAIEFADAGHAWDDPLRSALFAAGFVLLLLVLVVNLSLNLVPKEYKGKKGTKQLRGQGGEAVYRKKGLVPEILKYAAFFMAALVVAVLISIILFILINGIPHLSWSFLFGSSDFSHPSLLPAFISTGYVILISLAIALPVGIGAAIFLVEYAKPGSKLVKVIRTFVDTLAGVPSIVFGLFGNLFFCKIFGDTYSVVAGSFTMALIILPTIIRSTEESLIAVPASLREASYGLGAGKARTIFKVVLPSAFPGIATAAILAIGRIVGESAALIYTSGMLVTTEGSAVNPMNMGATLTVFLYMCWAEPNSYLGFNQAYATAVVLLLCTLILNFAVYLIQRRVQKKQKR